MLVLLAALALGAGPLDSRLCLVSLEGDQLQMACAASAGTPVTVFDGQKETAIDATVVGPTTCGERLSALDTTPGVCVRLKVKDGAEAPSPGIGIVGGAKLVKHGKRYSALLDGKEVRFHECASSEGLHLTAWDGKPRKSKRLWHAYLYVDMDLEGDCTPAEYE